MPRVIDKQIRTIQNGERTQVVREKTLDKQAAKKKATKLITKVAVTGDEVIDMISQYLTDNPPLPTPTLTTIMSDNPMFSGVGIDIKKQGSIYNFSGTGAMNHQQDFVGSDKFYIVTVAQYPDFALFGTEHVITYGWVELPAPPVDRIGVVPLWLDATGIYLYYPGLTTLWATLAVGSRVEFSQTEILF